MQAIENTGKGIVGLGQTSMNWQMRPYREGDIPKLVELTNSIEAIEKQERGTTVEELERSFGQPFSEPLTQVIVAEGPQVSGVPAGLPPGYGRIVDRMDSETGERLYHLILRTHPAAREAGIERALVGRLINMARHEEADPSTPTASKVYVIAGAREGELSVRALYREIGLEEIRWGWIMERSLDEPLSEAKEVEGVMVRHYDVPDDDAVGLAAFNNSFIDHFEFHALTPDIWTYLVTTPHMRPDLSWLAFAK